MNIKDLTDPNKKWNEWFPPIEPTKLENAISGCGVTVPDSVPDLRFDHTHKKLKATWTLDPEQELSSRCSEPKPIIEDFSIPIPEDFDFTLPFDEEEFPMKETPKVAPGFIVVHQNVGTMPTHHAEAYCARVKEKFTQSKEWLEFKEKYPNWSFLLLPTREFDSWVEVFHEDEKHQQEVSSVILRNLSEEPPKLLRDCDELYLQAKDYVFAMLGAPVVKVELTTEQFIFCYKHSLNVMTDIYAKKKEYTLLDHGQATNRDFFFTGILAHAKIIIGRIRMSQGVPNDGRMHLDGEQMYKEGKDDLKKWKEALEFDEGAKDIYDDENLCYNGE